MHNVERSKYTNKLMKEIWDTHNEYLKAVQLKECPEKIRELYKKKERLKKQPTQQEASQPQKDSTRKIEGTSKSLTLLTSIV